jgi:hypothetical protein
MKPRFHAWRKHGVNPASSFDRLGIRLAAQFLVPISPKNGGR